MMKFLIVFALVFATVSTKYLHSRSIEVPVLENEGRITNGKKAKPGQFHYQVGISFRKFNGSLWCSGSLIGNNWILTAAHCTEGASWAKVFLGATQRLAAEKVYTVREDEIIIHPNWNPQSSENDISLMIIPKTPESNRTGIVRIPSKYENNAYVGYIVVVSGWGYINNDAKALSNDLQYGIMKVSPGSVCSYYYKGDFSDDKNICVATPERVSICDADSGDPLVLDGQNLQIGLASFGSVEGCARGLPTAYTRISAYLAWIRSHTQIDW